MLREKVFRKVCSLLDHRGLRVQSAQMFPFRRADHPQRKPLPHLAHLEVGHQAELPLQKSATEGCRKGFTQGRFLYHFIFFKKKLRWCACEFEPVAAGWLAQTKPHSYGDHPHHVILIKPLMVEND